MFTIEELLAMKNGLYEASVFSQNSEELITIAVKAETIASELITEEETDL